MEPDEKSTAEPEAISGSTTKGDNEPNTSTTEGSSSAEKSPGDNVTPAQPEHEYVTGLKLGLVIASVSLMAFLMLLDISIVVTAIPRITSDFHSLPDVGWYGSAYLLTNCSLQPLTGKLYSMFSSKTIFLSALGIFELGSALCGAAHSSNMLIIGRAIAGMGASGIMNGALTIIGATVPMPKRPALMGVMMSIGQIGIVGGPLIGGALTQYASWRWCFYINLPIGALAAVFIVLIKIPDRLRTKIATDPSATTSVSKRTLTLLSKLDLPGFVLFAPFAIQLLLALEWGGTDVHPWKSAIIIGLFCGAGGTLALFLAWEWKVGDEAMIPFSMIRKRIVWTSCLVQMLFSGSIFTVVYYLPIYFQAVKGVSPSLSGVYILPGILSQMFVAIIAGILVGKLGYYLPWIIVSGALNAIGVGMLSTLTPHSSTAEWICYQILAGVGRGCGMQIPIIATQNSLAPTQIPVGMAILVFSQTFGGSIFLTFAELIFSTSLVAKLHQFAPTVNVQAVITAGATAIRTAVKEGELAGVLAAYSVATDRIFYLGTACASALFVCAWGMGWVDIREKKKPVGAPEEV